MKHLALAFVIACAGAPAERLERPNPRPAPQVYRPKPPRSLMAAILPDVEIVLEARVFATRGVGFTGEPLREAVAARTIARSADAIPALEWLAIHAGPAGQLFAVWALHAIDPQRATSHLVRLSTDDRMVETTTGCIAMPSTASKVAAAIADGEHPLEPKRPSEDLCPRCSE